MRGRGKYLFRIQSEHDIMKYFESQKAGKDLCGTYKYCSLCNKKNKFPCGAAYDRLKKERI